MPIRLTITLCSIALLLAQSAAADEKPIRFAREILPVLSNKCFVCHGPDSAGHSDLRLDLPEQATALRDGYRVVDPERPEASKLLERIHSADDPMPPMDAEKQLTQSERELLTRWIQEGGVYAMHWAFVAPEKPESTANALDSHEVIDQLIGAQHRTKGIDFAEPADRATLARRAALTLTGLPPEPDQLRRFIGDESDQAYERLVDELLQSPRFGEHHARYWLDAVRYGDTHGLHLDNRRGIYPYRDWVVRALNENLPFDEFITWQLAGDLLPEPTLAQRIATGYVRLNPSTGEGGAIAEEFQAKNNFDRVENFGTVFLGMSLTCARCHTHKYDPITQTDYYRLLAFFNSTAEPALDGNSYTYGPTVRAPADQQAWDEWQDLTSERTEVLRNAAETIERGTDLTKLIEHAQSRAGWSTSDWQISPLVSQDAAVPTQWSKVAGLPGSLSGRSAKGKLPGADQSVWVSFQLDVPVDQKLFVTFTGGPGSQLFVADAARALAMKLTADRAVMVPVQFRKGKQTVRIQIVGAGNGADSEIEIQTHNPWDALAKTKQWAACSDRDRLLMLADVDGPLAALGLGERAKRIVDRQSPLEANFTTSLVAQELPNPRPTRLLKRGEYDLPQGDPLQPGIIEVMSPFPKDAPANRMGLARWLTSRDHPLVSRVLMNRIWLNIFGHGLVRSPEDFGLQGQQPTHPELLDWLAVEFQDSGWDLKKMMRMMVLSRTFQQSAAWRSDIDDPENRLYARGPSYRLDAEVLRDLGLWASGLLDPHMGGEGVKPYQPPGMWLALAHPGSNTKLYQRDQGQRLYRRSLYVYWKRTSPHPMMTLFDAPDRESSCVRRSRTNTSLQSLGLLNEEQRIEMARSLAERLIGQADDDEQRLDDLFLLVASRKANANERDACLALLKNMRERYAASVDDALGLLSTGEAQRDTSLNPAEQAAWTQLAATVLASDIAIMLY